MKSAKPFQNKSILVTGAASGIGRELTRQLLQAGANVAACDINEAGLNSLKAEANSLAGQLDTAVFDVSDRAAFEQAIQDLRLRHGTLDYIFNNAGYAIFDEVKAMGPQQWERIIDVNIRGVVNGTDIAYKIMCEQKQGHIVNTASGAGLMPIPLMTAYCMTKHAVVGLSTSLREEGKRYNVHVSAICPGVISTNIFNASHSNSFDIPAMVQGSPVSEIPVAKAVQTILKQVLENQSKIVFPVSIKLSSRFYSVAPAAYSRLAQLGLKKLITQLK